MYIKMKVDNTELDEKLLKIKQGLKINHMQMKDGTNGKVLWESKDWDLHSTSHIEKFTKELLKCKVVIRNVNFSSTEQIEDLELIQNFYLMGELLETSRFKFGFVIPGSTNDWEQIIEAKDLRAAVECKMPFEEFVKWQNFQQEQKTKISIRIWLKRIKH